MTKKTKTKPNSDDASRALKRIERWCKKKGDHHYGFAGPPNPLDKRLGDIELVREYIESLHGRIVNASFTLMDWDGYYNPKTKRGSVQGLSEIVEEAYTSLQGKSWRSDK